MSDNQNDIARRVRGLLNKTVANGCTEAEALAAAAAARRLMDAHRLTQSDVEIEAEPIDDVLVERPVDQKTAAVDYIMRGLNAYCGVKTWFTWRGGKRVIRMLGLHGDTEMARYLYEMMAKTIERDSAAYIRTIRDRCHDATATRRYRQSYQIGMATRVNERLHQMAKERDAVAVTGTGTALVVVKGAMVADAWDRLGIKLGRATRGMGVRSYDAHSAGRAAGDRVNLSRPVSGAAQGRIA